MSFRSSSERCYCGARRRQSAPRSNSYQPRISAWCQQTRDIQPPQGRLAKTEKLSRRERLTQKPWHRLRGRDAWRAIGSGGYRISRLPSGNSEWSRLISTSSIATNWRSAGMEGEMNYARWLLFLVAATNASAQDKNPYDGEWLIKIERNAYRGEADLTISGSDGTYRRRLVGGKDDPCAKREIPITITKATADELEYTIYGSKALAGCPD